jgi:hypothetical protein
MTDAETYYRARWDEEPPANLNKPSPDIAFAPPNDEVDRGDAAHGLAVGMAVSTAIIAAIGLGYSLAAWVWG